MDLRQVIRDIPDFPKEGIIFKDITPLLKDPASFKYAIDSIANHHSDSMVDLVLGAEARGFIIAGALAYRLNAGFIPARKPGKLPHEVTTAEYELEYGMDSLEMHKDAILAGDRVLIVDDVLATGGTAAAKINLVEGLGGIVVGTAFLIELTFLGGRSRLGDKDVLSLVQY